MQRPAAIILQTEGKLPSLLEVQPVETKAEQRELVTAEADKQTVEGS